MAAKNLTFSKLAITDSETIHLVASRMRETLIEVLGQERGANMYSEDWLRQRVMQHLDGTYQAVIWLAHEQQSNEVVGHTIVRRHLDDAPPNAKPNADSEQKSEPSKREIGLFSTIYVAENWRRSGVASQLITHGEAWIDAQKLQIAATNTGEHNEKLIRLFEKHGYQIVIRTTEMVRLERIL